jgi:hypothetical protein
MLIFHKTNQTSSILSRGFQEESVEINGSPLQGVWFSNDPLDSHRQSDGDMVLFLDIPESLLVPYELTKDSDLSRTFFIPVEILQPYGLPKVLTLASAQLLLGIVRENFR